MLGLPSRRVLVGVQAILRHYEDLKERVAIAAVEDNWGRGGGIVGVR